MSFKKLFVVFSSIALLALASGMAWASAPLGTTTSINYDPGATVVQGSAASAIGNTIVTGGSAVTSGNMELQTAVLSDGVTPTTCESQQGFLSGTSPDTLKAVDSNGSATFTLDTSTVGTIGYRMHYISAGNTYGTSKSGCIDFIVIAPPCTGVNISADLAGGNGTPQAGPTPQTWTVEIKVHACEDATNLKAQGGTNAWQSSVSVGAPSVGSITGIKYVGKNNEVITWSMDSLSAGSDATLLLTITGTIKANTPSGTVLGLTGPWSVVYTTADGVTQKSDYTGAVTVTVQ